MHKINKSIPKNLTKNLAKSVLENLAFDELQSKEAATEKLDGVKKHAKPVPTDKVKKELPAGAALKTRFSKATGHPKLKDTLESDDILADEKEAVAKQRPSFRKALEKKYGAAKGDRVKGQLERKAIKKEDEAKKDVKDAEAARKPVKASKEAQNARISWMNDIVNAAESIKGLGKSAPGEWTREKLSKKTNLELWKLRGEAQRLANETNFKNKGTAKVSVPAKKSELMKGATSATQESFKGAGRTKLTVADRIALRKAALEARQAPRLDEQTNKKVTEATPVSRQRPRLKK